MDMNSESAHQITTGDHKQGALWLGDYQSATNLNFLTQNQIRTVITVAIDLPIKYNSQNMIKHIIYKVEDRVTANISQYFDSSIQQIDIGRKMGNVLIHCAAGISRSATIVIAYIMYTNGWSLSKSMAYVKLKRPQIQPNEGFLIQLRQHEIRQNSNLKKQLGRCLTQVDIRWKSNELLHNFQRGLQRK